jgi:H+/gluconate symporter-like permease
MTPLLIFLFALVLILVLTTKFRGNPFLSLLTVSLFVAIVAEKPFEGLESILAKLSDHMNSSTRCIMRWYCGKRIERR